MATAFTALAALSTVASGAVGYLGAQQQAAQVDHAAKVAENQAKIAHNNAVAKAGDEIFQSSVDSFNKKEALSQTDRRLKDSRDKTRMALASRQAQAAKSGTLGYSFNDVLRSNALLAEREEADILYRGGVAGYQHDRSSSLATMRAGRSIEMGRYDSAMYRSKASSLRSQASSTRSSGIGSLVGGVVEGATIGSEIWI